MSAGNDLIGQRFGALTVISLETERSARGDRIWRCSCDCGGSAERCSGYLNQSRKIGRFSHCISCETKRRQTAMELHRKRNLESWGGLWRRFHTLWSTSALDRLERKIRSASERDSGRRLSREAPPVDVESPEESPDESVDKFYAHTLEEIGAKLDISKEMVRQIETTALAKVRSRLIQLYPDVFAPRFDLERINGAILRAQGAP